MGRKDHKRGIVALLVFLMSIGLPMAIWQGPALAKDPDQLKFKALYTFGDSLVDTGNLFALSGGAIPPEPPYFDGRFTNGAVWTETLAGLLNASADFDTPAVFDPLASNQAFGGAFTDYRNENAFADGTGIFGQVESFTSAGGKFSPLDLIVVWGGSNDYLFDPAPNYHATVDNLKRTVEDLADLGGRIFVVPNLPNLGDTPLIQFIGEPFITHLNQLVALHNQLLDETMTELAEDENIQIIVLDVNAQIDAIIQNATSPFTNVEIPCVIQGAVPIVNEELCPLNAFGIPDSAPSETLFFDTVHPAKEAHNALAFFAYGVITAALSTNVPPQFAFLHAEGQSAANWPDTAITQ